MRNSPSDPSSACSENERLQLREAEHLAFRVVGLDQPVAVEEGRLAGLQGRLLLLIAHPWHKPQGHPSSPEFLRGTVTMEVRQIVAGIGVAEATAVGIEYGVEAGDEHIRWDVDN